MPKGTKTPSIRNSIQDRGKNPASIYHYYSRKNGKRLILLGEVAILWCRLLEADPRVVAYYIDQDWINARIQDEDWGAVIDITVLFREGDREWFEWWECKRAVDAGPVRTGRADGQISAQAQAALRENRPYFLKTEEGLRGRELECDNWFQLESMMNMCRTHPKTVERALLLDHMRVMKHLTVYSLLDLPGCDPVLMRACIAEALADGHIHADLRTALFTDHTTLHLEALS